MPGRAPGSRGNTNPAPSTGSWPAAARPTPQSSRITSATPPKRVCLTDLVRVAGARWAIEETFQTAKGQTGLDHYQVRQYTGWYRHITLSILAHAFLTVTRSK